MHDVDSVSSPDSSSTSGETSKTTTEQKKTPTTTSTDDSKEEMDATVCDKSKSDNADKETDKTEENGVDVALEFVVIESEQKDKPEVSETNHPPKEEFPEGTKEGSVATETSSASVDTSKTAASSAIISKELKNQSDHAQQPPSPPINIEEIKIIDSKADEEDEDDEDAEHFYYVIDDDSTPPTLTSDEGSAKKPESESVTSSDSPLDEKNVNS